MDIDDDVLLAAQELAEVHGSTAGKVLSDLARKALGPARKSAARRNGIPLLPARKGARPVTSAKVNALFDDESA
ncbi:MAG TPA: CopG family transcriptional regulator [Thermoanaerobaculia bacterium]